MPEIDTAYSVETISLALFCFGALEKRRNPTIAILGDCGGEAGQTRRLALALAFGHNTMFATERNSVSWEDVDIGAEVVSAGGAASFLAHGVAMRDLQFLAVAVENQRNQLRSAVSGLTEDSSSVRAAAVAELDKARARIAGASSDAAEAVSEYEDGRARLQAILDAFKEHRTAVAEENAVKKCRVIADAYVDVLKTLSAHHKQGSKTADMDTVAKNVDVLIREVDLIRRAGARSLFGESLAVNKRILTSIENRCVDAVIQSRAVFVNVMDNEFRAFGWPMKVPQVGENASMISTVNFFVAELNKLQAVAERFNFVAERSRWHRALSDSWAMAAILRAPLARFKYHFLENYRASSSGGGAADGDGDNSSAISSVVQDAESEARAGDSVRAQTSRFDRPEWAAEFALERITEATPFLREIVLDNSCTADLKFAEGFCKVFANKVAYDCDLASRASNDERATDTLVSHAAGTAAQFDARMRQGLLANNPVFGADDKLPSSLGILSMNDHFFANWALSELRLAQATVLESVARLLDPASACSEGPLGAPSDGPEPGGGVDGYIDVESECVDIVERVSRSSRGCHQLDSAERKLSFVKWTEIHLLEAVRGVLREHTTAGNGAPGSGDSLFKACRASWIAHSLANALENKACEEFYVGLEQYLETRGSRGRADKSASVYASEIERLRVLSSQACIWIGDAVVEEFVSVLSGEYQEAVRFGELGAPDAAVVLAHDLSMPLCDAMVQLEAQLRAMRRGIGNRKVLSLVWRPVAERLDCGFMDDIVLQAYTGGARNAACAASAANSYMVPTSAAKMARQIAHDARTLVDVFGAVTAVPARFVRRCADASLLLDVASHRVLRPRAPSRQRDEEVLRAILETGLDASDSSGEQASEGADGASGSDALRALRERVGVSTLTTREARECLVIGGMYDVLPLE